MYGSLITTQSRAYIIPTTMGAVVLYCDRDKIWIANAALACHCAHSTTCMGGGGGWISRPFFCHLSSQFAFTFLFFLVLRFLISNHFLSQISLSFYPSLFLQFFPLSSLLNSFPPPSASFYCTYVSLLCLPPLPLSTYVSLLYLFPSASFFSTLSASPLLPLYLSSLSAFPLCLSFSASFYVFSASPPLPLSMSSLPLPL